MFLPKFTLDAVKNTVSQMALASLWTVNGVSSWLIDKLEEATADDVTALLTSSSTANVLLMELIPARVDQRTVEFCGEATVYTAKKVVTGHLDISVVFPQHDDMEYTEDDVTSIYLTSSNGEVSYMQLSLKNGQRVEVT